MAELLKWLGWILIAIAAAVIAYPFLFRLIIFDPLINALPAGVLVALGAQLLAQGKGFADDREKQSHFFLESCVRAYEEARALLQDGNNDRVAWVAAGRALVHAKDLSGKVVEDSHRKVLELHKLKYRGFFSACIADKPASFFYGAKDESISIDEAAALSTAREERGGRVATSTLKSLSDKSLRAVWEAAQWPEGYEDPLDRGFSQTEKAKLTVLFPGLHAFLEHKEVWHSASGELFKREEKNARH